MNLEKKINKIKELDKITFPTPEQIEERLKLEDEVELELRDSGLTLHQFNQQAETNETQLTKEQYYEEFGKKLVETPIDNPEEKKKMTIYEKYIKPKLGGKPATWDEIQQLKLEAMKARLKTHIAKDKAQQRQFKADRINSIFGMVTGRGTESNTAKKNKKDKSTKGEDDLRSLLGSSDPTKYDKLLRK